MNEEKLEQKLRKVHLLPPPPQAKREVLQAADRRAAIYRGLRIAVVALAAAAALMLVFNFLAVDFIRAGLDVLVPFSPTNTVECARTIKARHELLLETLEFNVNGESPAPGLDEQYDRTAPDSRTAPPRANGLTIKHTSPKKGRAPPADQMR